MTTATATEVKNRFGEFMEKARREPVQINKSGRGYAVLISQEDFDRFQALEDRYWAEKAREAQQQGHVGTEAAMAALRKSLEAE